MKLLTEAAANRQNVLTAFDQLALQVSQDPEATVIIYYSGHGGKLQRGAQPADYFLLTHGFDLKDLRSTTISGAEFTSKIQAIAARKLVILLDCCHAAGMPALKSPGAQLVKALPREVMSALEKGSGRVVAASSREDEESLAGSPYSLYTACLLEALEGRAAKKQDGFARILDVLSYLFDEVPERARRLLANHQQHPFVNRVDGLDDNFPLCYYAGGKTKSPNTNAAPPAFVAPTFLTLFQRQKLEGRRDALMPEWKMRSEKLKKLRAALAIEAGTVVQFQLEQEVLNEEAKLAWLVDEIEKIETALQKA